MTTLPNRMAPTYAKSGENPQAIAPARPAAGAPAPTTIVTGFDAALHAIDGRVKQHLDTLDRDRLTPEGIRHSVDKFAATLLLIAVAIGPAGLSTPWWMTAIRLMKPLGDRLPQLQIPPMIRGTVTGPSLITAGLATLLPLADSPRRADGMRGTRRDLMLRRVVPRTRRAATRPGRSNRSDGWRPPRSRCPR